MPLGARPSRPTGPSRPSSRGTTIRRARKADLPLLVLHRRRMWQEIGGYTPRELDRHDRDYRRWVRGETAAGRFLAFVAEGPDGRPLGSGAIWLMPSQPRPGPLGRRAMPYLLSMFTEPRARRTGVASRLVRSMVEWARSGGYGRVVLHASLAGRSVYERLGFTPTNEMRLELARPRRRPQAPRRP